MYVVEDVQTSYWPPYGGSSDTPDARTVTVGYFKSLIHGMNYMEINSNKDIRIEYCDSIVSMHFYHNLIMIRKGDNTEQSNVAIGHVSRSAGSAAP